MTVNKNKISIAYVFISIVVIVVLIYILSKYKKNESFCSCRNMITKICPNPKELTSLYERGILTENTDLRKFGKPTWKTIMPDDQFYDQQNNIPYTAY
jgi:hypothetical protein